MPAPLSVTGTEREEGTRDWGGGGRGACTGVYKREQAVRPGSVAGWGCYGVVEFEMFRRIKSKRKYVRISLKEIGRNLDGPPKGKIRSYVMINKSFPFFLVCRGGGGDVSNGCDPWLITQQVNALSINDQCPAESLINYFRFRSDRSLFFHIGEDSGEQPINISVCLTTSPRAHWIINHSLLHVGNIFNSNEQLITQVLCLFLFYCWIQHTSYSFNQRLNIVTAEQFAYYLTSVRSYPFT